MEFQFDAGANSVIDRFAFSRPFLGHGQTTALNHCIGGANDHHFGVAPDARC
jgi:hypothetical protein